MRRHFSLAAALAIGLAASGRGQPPAPSNQPAQPAQPAPWANKFFLPNIEKNRDQPSPALIQHNFGDVPHGTLCTS